MVVCNQNEWERLVVAKQDIVARLELLDEICLKQQRFGLRCRDHKFHGARFGDHAQNAIGVASCLGV